MFKLLCYLGWRKCTKADIVEFLLCYFMIGFRADMGSVIVMVECNLSGGKSLVGAKLASLHFGVE